MDGPFPPLPTNRNAAERAIDETLDQLGFATINPHNDCRDHKHSGVRVHFMGDDERCAIYAFAGRPGGLLRYEISLPYAAPVEVLRAAIVAATTTNEGSRS